jgi:hypothetical protein
MVFRDLQPVFSFVSTNNNVIAAEKRSILPQRRNFECNQTRADARQAANFTGRSVQ